MSSPSETVWLGYDPRQAVAFAVARWSIKRFNRHVPVRGVILDNLRRLGLYWRPTEIKLVDQGWGETFQLRDTISDAPMATEFAISRFLTPHLAGSGWALFMDCDVLVTQNVTRLFALADPTKAVMCVKHRHEPTDDVKMDGQQQTHYRRKNWSSVMLFNCDHPSNDKLTVDLINSVPGRDLHAFCWLADDEIGELPPTWNWLSGHDDVPDGHPAVVHFTNGLPDVPGYEDQPFADDWRGMVPYAVGAI